MNTASYDTGIIILCYVATIQYGNTASSIRRDLTRRLQVSSSSSCSVCRFFRESTMLWNSILEGTNFQGGHAPDPLYSFGILHASVLHALLEYAFNCYKTS